MGQRRKCRPGEHGYRNEWIGEVFLEWGEGEVLERAQPPGREHEIVTSRAGEGRRNAVMVIKPQHLEHPMALTIDTHDGTLPRFVRDDPCSLVGHTIGYKAVVRRTQAFVRAAPGNLDLPIDKVRGSADGARYKVRELTEVVEIDERDPQQWAGAFLRQVVDESDPASWPEKGEVPGGYEPTLEAMEAMHTATQAAIAGRQVHAEPRAGKLAPGIFGALPASGLSLDVKVQAMRAADRSIAKFERWLAQTDDPGDAYRAFREFTFVCIERVMVALEDNFEGEHDSAPAFLVACDLVEGALACYLPRARLPLDEVQLDQLEAKVIDFATSSYRQLSDWRID